MSQDLSSPLFAPTDEIEAARPQVMQRLERLRESLVTGLYVEVAGEFGAALLTQQHRLMEADEGTVWLLDAGQTHLVPVWSNGPEAAKFVGVHRQPLNQGLVSMVCQTETSFCENEVHRHRLQDGAMDRLVGRLTCSMVAVPLRCGGSVCGVLSAVKLKDIGKDVPEPPPFPNEATAQLGLAAAALGAWLDANLLEQALGLSHS